MTLTSSNKDNSDIYKNDPATLGKPCSGNSFNWNNDCINDEFRNSRESDFMDNRRSNPSPTRKLDCELEYDESSNVCKNNKTEVFPNLFTNNYETDKLNINVFRFKFTQEVMDALFEFSKIHQYDGRKIFKESWSIWCDENEEFIRIEKQRLHELGYDGEIEDKMYKSARYYFRKKRTDKTVPKERRDYIGMSRDMLDAMDQHIYNGLLDNDFKPSEGFDDFCAQHTELLKIEINKMVKSGLKSASSVQLKVKKTYKNRHFLVIKNRN